MEYSFDDYVKSIIYYTRGEYVEEILSSRMQTYYAIYIVRTNKNAYVIKLFTEDNKGSIEENALYYLRKASFIKVPKVYNVYEKSEEIPYSAVIMEKISDGNILSRIPLHLTDTIIEDMVTNIIYKDKDYDIGSFGEIGREKYATWQEYYKLRALEDTKKAKTLLINGKIPVETYLEVMNLYYNFDDIFSEKIERATLIHGNYSIDNIFFNKNGLAVALINPHIAMYGDSEYETISLDKRKNKGLDILEEYKKRVPLSSNFNEKYNFYYLYDIIERNYSVLETHLRSNRPSRKDKKIIKKYRYE